MTDNWKDLKLWQYREICAIPDDDEDRYFKILAVLNECDYDDIMSRPIPEVMAMKDKVAFLNEMPRIRKAKDTYTLGKTKYRFTWRTEEITTAQYMDLSNTPDDLEHIVDLLAICLVPEGKKYGQDYRFDDVKKDIDDYMTLEEARAVTSFFTGRFLILLKQEKKRMKKYLKKAVKDKAITEKERKELQRKLDENPLLGFNG